MKKESIGIMGRLKIESRPEAGFLVLVLSGKADVYTSGDLAKLGGEFIRQGQARIALDCSELEYLDSATLSALLSLQKAATAAGGRIVLFSLEGEPRSVFATAGFEKLFPILSGLEAARAELA